MRIDNLLEDRTIKSTIEGLISKAISALGMFPQVLSNREALHMLQELYPQPDIHFSYNLSRHPLDFLKLVTKLSTVTLGLAQSPSNPVLQTGLTN